jgi:hypothetical protein
MAEVTLDRSRHFAVIYGAVDNGAVYHQDGIDFRGDGTPIGDFDSEDSAEDEAVVEADKPATRAKAPKKPKAEDLPPVDTTIELPPVDSNADSADDLV